MLGVKQHRSWYKLSVSHHDQKLLALLISEVKYPGQAYLIILNDTDGYDRNLGKILSQIENACIYRS